MFLLKPSFVIRRSSKEKMYTSRDLALLKKRVACMMDTEFYILSWHFYQDFLGAGSGIAFAYDINSFSLSFSFSLQLWHRTPYLTTAPHPSPHHRLPLRHPLRFTKTTMTTSIPLLLTRTGTRRVATRHRHHQVTHPRNESDASCSPKPRLTS